MAIVRWQPRSMVRSAVPELDHMQSEFDRLWDWAVNGGDSGNWTRPLVPAMDVIEEENQYVIRADLPGLTKEDIEITYQGGILTLKGEKESTRKPESGRHYLHERFEGKFGRNLQLPEKVDVDRIEAGFENGVLELRLPFTPEAQPKKIEIKK